MKYKVTLATVLAASLSPVSLAHAADDAPSAIHGFGILNIQNDYITPRGLMVTNKGVTVQVIGGLVFGLYHQPDAAIDDVAFVVGTFNDIDSTQHATTAGAWNEFDWFAGPSFHFEKDWNLDVQLGQFLSPPGNFKAETNLEFALSYNDAGWGLPLLFKPYVKLFYALSGDSTVVTGRHGGTFDVEIGMAPTIDLAPFTLSAPTWITVGPETFWGGGGNVGVFSTGLTLTYPLPIPTPLGHWSAKAGFQYYNFINDRLRLAQTLIGTANPGSGGHNDEVNGFVGLSFGF
ncbi:MAG TPA: hypothetical protein VNH44_13870 [Micropepsaceae bacterium]|nr:hypothetical protein [Micropepsaceae bacterium]